MSVRFFLILLGLILFGIINNLDFGHFGISLTIRASKDPTAHDLLLILRVISLTMIISAFIPRQFSLIPLAITGITTVYFAQMALIEFAFSGSNAPHSFGGYFLVTLLTGSYFYLVLKNFVLKPHSSAKKR